MPFFGPREPDPNVVAALNALQKLVERLEGELVTSALRLADAEKREADAEVVVKQAIEQLRAERANWAILEANLRSGAVNRPVGVDSPPRAPRPAVANSSIGGGHAQPPHEVPESRLKAEPAPR